MTDNERRKSDLRDLIKAHTKIMDEHFSQRGVLMKRLQNIEQEEDNLRRAASITDEEKEKVLAHPLRDRVTELERVRNAYSDRVLDLEHSVGEMNNRLRWLMNCATIDRRAFMPYNPNIVYDDPVK